MKTLKPFKTLIYISRQHHHRPEILLNHIAIHLAPHPGVRTLSSLARKYPNKPTLIIHVPDGSAFCLCPWIVDGGAKEVH